MTKNNRDSNRKLCDAASSIQRILSQGYHITKWINAAGVEKYWLVEDGKAPYEGVYLSDIKK